jgi:drug/metabolite transporter (DMT)-like permease
MDTANRRRFKANATLLACAAVWGVAFVFQKRAMEHIGPFLFIALRAVLACIALAWLARREWRLAGGRVDARKLARISLLAGGAFFGGAAFQQAGLVTATATNAGFLTALYVVVTPFLAWMILRQRPGKLVWAAAALSFAGAWLLGGASLDSFSTGDLLIAISAILWALHVVLVGLAAGGGMAATFTAGQFVVVALLSGAVAGACEPINVSAIWRAAPDLLYVGILSSALTFTLLAVALRATRPSEAAVILSTESLFAAAGAYIMLGERLSALGWTGAAAIFAATLLVHAQPLLDRAFRR